MPTSVLTTKLYIPPIRPELVSRPRLIEQLDEGLHRKLTLISAPAGFGKTMLLSEWSASHAWPFAWISLDASDGDPHRFLVYIISAVQTISSNLGDRMLAALQSPQPPPSETILASLVNDIAALPENFILVLDDYHLIDAEAVDQALAYLLENMPPQMHVVITTREDPRLPIARYRARGQLTELRIRDLRFTSSEVSEFLNQMMGLSLTPEEVASLQRRTEGWIAGLQLAALSMQGREDIPGFIQTFAGDNRYIVDYLADEVLSRQPEHIRTFLLQTSILDRLSGPLCDAVTAQPGSAVLLETLERGNLFVIPLDDRRRWYRYHHLFADVLRAHALDELTEQVPNLHRRASAWYQHNDSPVDAICHAYSAGDFERAADLIELAWPGMEGNFQIALWLNMVSGLPDELIHARPVLAADYGWALLQRGDLETADSLLHQVEQWLDTEPHPGEESREPANRMVIADQEQFRTLPAILATARTYQAQALGNIPRAVEYGERALALLPEEDHLRRGMVAALLGVAYWGEGDMELAHRTLSAGMEDMRLAGNILFALRGTYILADIRVAQGRLREAISTYEHYLQLAETQGEHVLRGTADLYLRLSELLYEQNIISIANEQMHKAEVLGQQDASLHWRYRHRLAQARLRKTQGDLNGALGQLDEAERLHVATPVPQVHPISALRAQIWTAQDRLQEALDWVQEQSLSVNDNLSFLREFEHVTLARVLIAQHRHTGTPDSIVDALALLERLLEAAEAGGRAGSMIEILVLEALAHEAQDDIPMALIPLNHALTLAGPEGYVRVFVDEGPPMARLLSEAASQGIMPEYANRLLAAFEAGSRITPAQQPLIEPLSERELEVLRLVAQGLTNQQIAERLFIAISTVKGHNQRIYAKLQAERRTEAIVRARELGLL